MKCSSTKELLAEIRHVMNLHDIPMKDLAFRMNTSQQNISRIFTSNNPTCDTFFEICHALNFDVDITIRKKDD